MGPFMLTVISLNPKSQRVILIGKIGTDWLNSSSINIGIPSPSGDIAREDCISKEIDWYDFNDDTDGDY